MINNNNNYISKRNERTGCGVELKTKMIRLKVIMIRILHCCSVAQVGTFRKSYAVMTWVRVKLNFMQLPTIYTSIGILGNLLVAVRN